MRFTVYFESPFWVGILEEERDGVLYVARTVFGVEPSNQQLYEFMIYHLSDLRAQMTVGLPVAAQSQSQSRKNPKRMQREIRREMACAGDGSRSKAHEVMRQQIEQGKQTRRQRSKAERDAEQERKRQIKRQKSKDKHRGR
ncbi:MAG: YjdF family protein [Anaerolineae bacterium]|nr:YjdF family protein [Anaerolineae bacterium]